MVTLKEASFKEKPLLQRNNSFLSEKGFLTIEKKLFQKAKTFIENLEEKLSAPSSVLCSYDFLVSEKRELKLIEINTNSSGFFWTDSLNKLHEIQQFPKAKESLFLSFVREFEKISNSKNLKKVVLLDEDLLNQKNLKEFYQFQDFFKSFHVDCELFDLKDLKESTKADLIYNRTCDFLFKEKKSSVLKSLFESKKIAITPNPDTYRKLADKSLMVSWYKKFPEFCDILLPSYFLFDIKEKMTKQERKNWFFKPKSSHGGKGAVSGKTISRKRFDSLDEKKFLAQKLVRPHKLEGGLKYELRFFTYEKTIQLLGASLYKGQTLHFSSPEEGLTSVKILK